MYGRGQRLGRDAGQHRPRISPGDFGAQDDRPLFTGKHILLCRLHILGTRSKQKKGETDKITPVLLHILNNHNHSNKPISSRPPFRAVRVMLIVLLTAKWGYKGEMLISIAGGLFETDAGCRSFLLFLKLFCQLADGNV